MGRIQLQDRDFLNSQYWVFRVVSKRDILNQKRTRSYRFFAWHGQSFVIRCYHVGKNTIRELTFPFWITFKNSWIAQ